MSYLEALTFMTKEQVVRKCKLHLIPKHLQAELLAEMPVAVRIDGKPRYFEGQVDAFLQERFPYRPAIATYQRVEGARPRGGRKVTTDDEAIYALQLKEEGKSYCEMLPFLRAKFPHRKGHLNVQVIRKCIQRYERRQARKSVDNLGINPIRPR